MPPTCNVFEIVKRGAWAQLESLLEISPNVVHQKDTWENIPLHWAAKLDQFECVRLLLRYGSSVRQTNIRGYTPLLEAAAGATRLTFAELYRAEVKAKLHSGFDGEYLIKCFIEAIKGVCDSSSKVRFSNLHGPLTNAALCDRETSTCFGL